MRDKITSIIMFLVILGIISVIGIFVMIGFDEVTKQLKIEVETSSTPDDFVSKVGDVENKKDKDEEKTIDDNIEVPRNFRKSF